jgi:hypothetical protein
VQHTIIVPLDLDQQSQYVVISRTILVKEQLEQRSKSMPKHFIYSNLLSQPLSMYRFCIYMRTSNYLLILLYLICVVLSKNTRRRDVGQASSAVSGSSRRDSDMRMRRRVV